MELKKTLHETLNDYPVECTLTSFGESKCKELGFSRFCLMFNDDLSVKQLKSIVNLIHAVGGRASARPKLQHEKSTNAIVVSKGTYEQILKRLDELNKFPATLGYLSSLPACRFLSFKQAKNWKYNAVMLAVLSKRLSVFGQNVPGVWIAETENTYLTAEGLVPSVKGV